MASSSAGEEVRRGLPPEFVIVPKIDPVPLAAFQDGLDVDQRLEPLGRDQHPVAAAPLGIEEAEDLGAERVGSDDPERADRADAHGEEIVDDGARAPQLISLRADGAGGQAGLDGRFGRRRVLFPVNIEAEVAEHADAFAGQGGEQGFQLAPAEEGFGVRIV